LNRVRRNADDGEYDTSIDGVIERIAGAGDHQDLSDCSSFKGCGGAAAQFAVASFDQAIRKIRRALAYCC